MTDSGQTPPLDVHLDELQDEIDDVRRRLEDPLDQGEHHFIDDDGEVPAGEDLQPTDDTIVPPG